MTDPAIGVCSTPGLKACISIGPHRLLRFNLRIFTLSLDSEVQSFDNNCQKLNLGACTVSSSPKVPLWKRKCCCGNAVVGAPQQRRYTVFLQPYYSCNLSSYVMLLPLTALYLTSVSVWYTHPLMKVNIVEILNYLKIAANVETLINDKFTQQLRCR